MKVANDTSHNVIFPWKNCWRFGYFVDIRLDEAAANSKESILIDEGVQRSNLGVDVLQFALLIQFAFFHLLLRRSPLDFICLEVEDFIIKMTTLDGLNDRHFRRLPIQVIKGEARFLSLGSLTCSCPCPRESGRIKLFPLLSLLSRNSRSLTPNLDHAQK